MTSERPSRDEDTSRDPQLEAAFARMVQEAEAPPDFVAQVLAQVDQLPPPRRGILEWLTNRIYWPASTLAYAAMAAVVVLSAVVMHELTPTVGDRREPTPPVPVSDGAHTVRGSGIDINTKAMVEITGEILQRTPYRVRVEATRESVITSQTNLLEQKTEFQLECGGKTFKVSNRPEEGTEASTTLFWSLDSCGDAVVTVYITCDRRCVERAAAVGIAVPELSSLSISRRYEGKAGLLRFLQEFKDGSHTFIPGDFTDSYPPSEAQRVGETLKRYRVNSIKVSFRIEVPPALIGHLELSTILRQEILQRLASVQQCAKITVNVWSGVVDLEGHIASAAQRAELRTIVQNSKGVIQVNDALQVIPKPLCQVVELMEPLMARAETEGLAWSVSLQKMNLKSNAPFIPADGVEPVYYPGEIPLLRIRTPAQSARYLYVDYYSADGQVAHLFPQTPRWPRTPIAGEFRGPLPPSEDPQNPLAPGTSLDVGHFARLSSSPPFGQELITVIISTAPLFPTPRYKPEPVEAYMDELRRVLTGDGQRSDVTSKFYVVRTQERP